MKQRAQAVVGLLGVVGGQRAWKDRQRNLGDPPGRKRLWGINNPESVPEGSRTGP
jgi:hypothetical protein